MSCNTSKNLKETGNATPAANNVEVNIPAEAGMWMMTQIEDSIFNYVKSEGMKLSSKEIYSAKEPSLSQAVVRIQIGENMVGTGSFISEKGLVLTDQQSALHAIASASSLENNLLKNGFNASSFSEERPAENYSLHILIEQVDITQKIEKQIPDGAGYNQKLRYQQQIRNQLIQERKQENENLLVEIKNAWGGNKQIMFVYKTISDVRLVHTPPASIPGSIKFDQSSSYTSNYAFLRAYNANGNPFEPSRHLKIDEKNSSVGNLALTLNFPASTYKYENSYALDFYHNILNPVLIKSQQSVLEGLEYTAARNSQKAIRNATQRSSLSSNKNYYTAVRKGVEQHGLIQKKKAEEKQLEEWIKNDSLRSITYRKLLEQLEQSYSIASQSADLLYASLYPLNNNALIQIAGMYAPYFKHLQNPDSLSFSNSQKQRLLQNHKSTWADINREAQTKMLADMIKTMATLPDGKIPFFLLDFFDPYQANSLNKNIRSFIDSLETNSIIFNPSEAAALLNKPIEEAQSQKVDPFVSFYNGLQETFTFARQNYLKHFPYAVPAQRRYVKALKEFRNYPLAFPDANGTLRFSVGRITSEGLTDTNTQSRFTSTNNATNGSFGGPVLNNEGELIGISVDKNPEYAIDDYMINSRESSVENIPISYILGLLRKKDTTKTLLQELGIKK
ncbi:MAG: S46 family peptidase [Balneolaceae bacterium]|nr:S46 family peptidase [Balneolaceae bacterium]